MDFVAAMQEIHTSMVAWTPRVSAPASFVLVLESLTKVRERKHHFLPSTMAGNAGHFLVLVQVAMQTILLSIILFLIPCVWLMFAFQAQSLPLSTALSILGS